MIRCNNWLLKLYVTEVGAIGNNGKSVRTLVVHNDECSSLTAVAHSAWACKQTFTDIVRKTFLFPSQFIHVLRYSFYGCSDSFKQECLLYIL